MKLRILICFLAVTVAFSGCEKGGLGGNGKISGYVKHHDIEIPSATVYIKYDATELPGTNSGDFDDQTTASLSDAHYDFENLRAGNYYLYSVGYDSSASETVKGGIAVVITSQDTPLDQDVSVTE